jgi:outer membrane protein assembly factor BamB
MGRVLALFVVAACGDNAALAPDPHCADWHQWGNNPAHTGESCATGQSLDRILADVVIDPLVPDEVADAGDLIVHYQAPLVDGDRVFMVQKGGTYTPCVPETDPSMVCKHPEDYHRFETQTWSELGYAWQGDALVQSWRFDSDWVPPYGREVVFHPVISGDRVVVPLSAGGVAIVDATTGKPLHTVRPFDHDDTVFVSGALAELGGEIFYNAVKLDPNAPYDQPMQAWLVEIDGDGRAHKADYANLVPGAPRTCYGVYDVSPDTPLPVIDANGMLVLPNQYPCGPQVPGFNQAPALAFDGTVYVATHAQFEARYSYVVSIDPGYFDVNWARSLRDLTHDGCDVLVQCGPGAPKGVEPYTGLAPAAEVTDDSTSSPVVLPDGRVLYGSWSFYNAERGHLFEFSRGGTVLASFDFGWDLTPALSTTNAGTRIVLKDNHYGEYGGVDQGPYYLTMLDDALEPVWQYQSTNTESCARQPDGSVTCTADHPHGFEWCINAPAIDAAGMLYANSEDGNLYAIGPDGALRQNLLLGTAQGASYTPVVLDHVGRIYALNAGRMYVVGAN